MSSELYCILLNFVLIQMLPDYFYCMLFVNSFVFISCAFKTVGIHFTMFPIFYRLQLVLASVCFEVVYKVRIPALLGTI